MSSDCVPLPQLEASSPADQRTTERIPVCQPVHLRTSDGWAFTATCTDVNLSGIGVDSDRLLKVGQRLELHVTARDGKTSKVPMMVIYRMGQHYGLSALASLQDVLELLPINS